jgi:hypothetical protein
MKSPNNANERLAGELKIYDGAGNPVIGAKVDDMLPNSFKNGSVMDIDIPWNGTNEKGMMVARGAYRVVLRVEYVDANDKIKERKKLLGTIGITR